MIMKFRAVRVVAEPLMDSPVTAMITFVMMIPDCKEIWFIITIEFRLNPIIVGIARRRYANLYVIQIYATMEFDKIWKSVIILGLPITHVTMGFKAAKYVMKHVI